MKKQTKNIITRNWVAGELRFYNKADIRTTVATFFILAFMILIVGGLIAMVYTAESHHTLFEVISAVILILIALTPFVALAIGFIGCIVEGKMLERGEFEITKTYITDKTEHMTRRHIIRYLHFLGFKKISVGRSVYEDSAYGDEYYIIHYKGKNTIKLFYPVTIYEYKEQ